jgi:hypothetical protein
MFLRCVFLTTALPVCLACLSLVACDAGFSKVPEQVEAEPEPQPEPEPEETQAPEDSGVVDEGYVPPSSTFEAEDESAQLSEIGDQAEQLCLAEQVRLEAVLRHFGEEEQWCLLLAIAEAGRTASSNTAFTQECESALSQCQQEGPEQTPEDFLRISAADLDCAAWSPREGCDPSVADTLVCLSDVVENLADRFNAPSACSLTRASGVPAAERFNELAELSAFELSNRCARVACLPVSTSSGDAGAP